MLARSTPPSTLHGVEHRDRGVEVVEARVDERERHDLAAEDLADLAVAVAGRAEAGAGEDRVADEQEVALALVDLVGLDDVEAVRAEPVHERRALGHALDEAELRAVRAAVDHESAVGRVDHVGKPLDRLDQLDLVAELEVQVVAASATARRPWRCRSGWPAPSTG